MMSMMEDMEEPRGRVRQFEDSSHLPSQEEVVDDDAETEKDPFALDSSKFKTGML